MRQELDLAHRRQVALTCGSCRKALRSSDRLCSEVGTIPCPGRPCPGLVHGFLGGYQRRVIRTWRKFRSPMSSWQETYHLQLHIYWNGRERQGLVQTEMCKSVGLDVVFWIRRDRQWEREDQCGGHAGDRSQDDISISSFGY